MEFILSEKSKPLIPIDGYTFCFHKMLANDIQRWTCSKSSCKCYLKIDNNKIIESNTDHKHDKIDENISKRQALSNSLKRKAVEDVFAKPSKLIRRELKHGDISTLTNNDLSLIRHNIHRARSTIHPSLPKSAMETHAILESMNYRYTTNDNEQFIFVNNSVSSIIGFSTERNLNVLCDVTDIYMDGTFNVCPKFFTQLFTIHGLKDDVYIPLVFFLLPDKQKITYELAFKYLVDHCSLHGMTLAPVQVFIDFEIAIHMAVESVWPTSQIRGCRFHLAQSWWRKIQNLGLSAIYKDTSSENETGNFLKLFFGLPFLRPIEVIDCFTDELIAIRSTGDNRIEEFMDYVFDNYISPEASFPPSIWAQFSTTSNRTTNSCESFHSKLNSCFYSGHPNIFVFINELLEVQSETYIKCRSNGTKKSKKQQEKQIFLREEMSRRISLRVLIFCKATLLASM
ncbi:hypothetical protein QTP88_016151 [Uroleucon formosanum]